MTTRHAASRTILITGCSSGIGRDAAHALRARGWRVVAACRKPADCERLRAEGFDAPLLDYERPETIERGFEAAMAATGGRLDALFNNGAYAIPGLVEDLPPAALRAILEANLVGWHDLTRRALAPMRTRGAGRIVQCSSVLGYVAAPWRGAYVATKHALEGLTDCLRLELRGSGIHVVLVEPGPIATRFRENARAEFERWIPWEASAHRLRYRALLALRVLALVALCLLFAEPWIPRPASLVDARALHVIAVDTSLSMRTGERFERALDVARERLAAVPEGDPVRVLAFDREAIALGEEAGDASVLKCGTAIPSWQGMEHQQ